MRLPPENRVETDPCRLRCQPGTGRGCRLTSVEGRGRTSAWVRYTCTEGDSQWELYLVGRTSHLESFHSEATGGGAGGPANLLPVLRTGEPVTLRHLLGRRYKVGRPFPPGLFFTKSGEIVLKICWTFLLCSLPWGISWPEQCFTSTMWSHSWSVMLTCRGRQNTSLSGGKEYRQLYLCLGLNHFNLNNQVRNNQSSEF